MAPDSLDARPGVEHAREGATEEDLLNRERPFFKTIQNVPFSASVRDLVANGAYSKLKVVVSLNYSSSRSKIPSTIVYKVYDMDGIVVDSIDIMNN